MVQVLATTLPEIEESVQARTGRQIRGLRIELRPERIVLRGSVKTYYLKQLAQQGVRDVLPHISLENAIVVFNPETTGAP